MMNRSCRQWRSIFLVSLAATLLLLVGFGYAVQDIVNPKLPPAAPAGPQAAIERQPGLKDANEIRITALGDSLTKGTGDSTGTGYVKAVVSGLKEGLPPGKTVSLINNLAINGLRADQLSKRLASDRGFRYALQQSNLILLTIGGNDLFQYAQGARRTPVPGQLDSESLSKQLPEGLARLKLVFKELNAINPMAKIVYVGLYNPFYDVPQLRSSSKQVQAWNEGAYALMEPYPNMMMVPTFDLFEGRIADYLSSDHFHPNHEGYKQIASRIVQSVR
ncbi:GDSL-type esterase/lipase family protein [Paenibacillus sp. GCM10023252]|uniref:GDSL-type esterase/lipase family protein n=1 Tax=Paenibacillus sp. GCM10023252 TaxID=3252649 RepID=UPI003615B993